MIQNSLFRIPVTPYVFQFLLHTYGSSPYKIAGSQSNDLKVSLLNMQMAAEPVVLERKLPGKYIVLDLGNDPVLTEALDKCQPLIKAGQYFQHEFNLIMRKAVEAILSYYPDSNNQLALASFLSAHGITEDIYPFDSAYRQLSRTKYANDAFFCGELRQKLRICAKGKSAYKAPKFTVSGKRKYVYFYATQSDTGELKRIRHYIPSYIKSPEDIEKYASRCISIITRLLQRGVMVA